MAIKILSAIINCFYVYGILICVRCLLTWIPGLDWNVQPFKIIRESADIYLDLFRKIIPPFGPFDISPMIAMFALYVFMKIFIFVSIFIMSVIGIR